MEVPYLTSLPHGSVGKGPGPTLLGRSSTPMNSTCLLAMFLSCKLVEKRMKRKVM